mmetsp:Transcript_9489/g.13468  ORF Transcript_9489/g.13468 Transcript_9489/m.13468 type:complete len:134 (+) Transcript_9489:77-478(+)
MSVRPNNLPPIQDMPPPGGFPKVDTVRAFPRRGPKGWQLWAGLTVSIGYGFYQIGKTNRERAAQKTEERKIRYALAPLLQAEADREYVHREKEILAKEAEVMKDVEGWKVGQSPYNSGRFMPRAINPFDKNIK